MQVIKSKDMPISRQKFADSMMKQKHQCWGVNIYTLWEAKHGSCIFHTKTRLPLGNGGAVGEVGARLKLANERHCSLFWFKSLLGDLNSFRGKNFATQSPNFFVLSFPQGSQPCPPFPGDTCKQEAFTCLWERGGLHNRWIIILIIDYHHR